MRWILSTEENLRRYPSPWCQVEAKSCQRPGRNRKSGGTHAKEMQDAELDKWEEATLPDIQKFRSGGANWWTLTRVLQTYKSPSVDQFVSLSLSVLTVGRKKMKREERWLCKKTHGTIMAFTARTVARRFTFHISLEIRGIGDAPKAEASYSVLRCRKIREPYKYLKNGSEIAIRLAMYGVPIWCSRSFEHLSENST